MHAHTGILAVVGSVCMMLALLLAWCLAGVRSSRVVKACFPSPQYLLKAHLDFLMMTGLLFVFFLVFEQLGLTPPMAIVVAMSIGSIGNPSGFLALALKPDLPQKPATPFGGKFRIIDFTLSNCINAGIRRIGVATQYKAQSLIRHLQRGWSFMRSEMGDFVDLLPAQQRVNEVDWYRGTADAVWQNLDIVRDMMADPNTLIALGDGGAHVDMLCDAGYPTYLLGTWVREKEAITLEEGVRKLTSDPADLFGLKDRGRLVKGAPGDVAIFDPARIGSSNHGERRFDLPGNAKRIVMPSRGVEYTVVNGAVTWDQGKLTEAKAGRVLRG